ncbi:hypothetical protein M011DRAFT_485531 [Sporormia fimetaria CBS 119925]|uniref:Uncharacterized protein n=1 Tax=Sporormia fimetaria CBS 119925 TaxID=1340428 RepID=A0A6A6VGQ5_9PLEO|nr:hypothetical protein M011DRAFT_485531 [Sporormia fimetaria CBS 119925]
MLSSLLDLLGLFRNPSTMSTAPSCPSCDDSPLSILANVIGIVTFAYLLLVGLSYRADTIAHAEADIRKIELEAQIASVRFRQWKDEMETPKLFPLSCYITTATAHIELHSLRISLFSYIGLKDLLLRVANNPDRASLTPYATTFELFAHPTTVGRFLRFWFNWRFVRRRNQLSEGLERFNALLEGAQSMAKFEDIESDIVEMRRFISRQLAPSLQLLSGKVVPSDVVLEGLQIALRGIERHLKLLKKQRKRRDRTSEAGGQTDNAVSVEGDGRPGRDERLNGRLQALERLLREVTWLKAQSAQRLRPSSTSVTKSNSKSSPAQSGSVV